MNYHFIAVDPGITGTGWAVFDNLGDYPIACGVMNKSAKDGDWIGTLHRFVAEMSGVLDKYECSKMVCELPQHFDSALGQAAAVSGDIVKLSCVVGAYATIIWQAKGVFSPVKVNDWKGQIPKDVTIKRINKLLPNLLDRVQPKSHDWDAIGIGLHEKGLFKPKK